MRAKKLIGYVRVSTAKQGHSGLGIEAQRDFELVRVFVEVETGKGVDALARTRGADGL
jgi:DNA invertase Pin-like site-specific DNA recombinase